MPTIQEAIAEWQRKVEAQNAESMQRLSDAYGRVYTRMETQQATLFAEIEAERAEGREPSKAALARQTRYQQLLSDIESEMGRYSGVLQDTVTTGQEAMAQHGLGMAESLVQDALAELPEEIGASVLATFQRMPREAVSALVGALQDSTPLGELLNTFGPDTAKGIGDALLANMVSGRGPREAAREMVNAWGVPLTRALTISRTEELRAFRAATLASYRANAHIVKGWKWMASLGPRTCMSCLALHGTTYTLDETLDDHPAGRCVAIPITPTWEELGLQDMPDTQYDLNPGDGEKWFREQPEAVQRQMMGPGKYDAWKDGKFEFSALSKPVPDARWGRVFVETPLKELVGDDDVA